MEGLRRFTMQFDLNEEQQQIKQSVREFAEGEIAPHVREWDETQHFPVELLPKLAPNSNFRDMFAKDPKLAEETAFRNSSLQGAYLMLAARALGLDCGPMSGFDAEKVNAELFPDGKWKANFLCNLGYGDPQKLPPRQPRLEFEEVCRVL